MDQRGAGGLRYRPASRYTGPAMTLENMREIGVRSIEAACECGHKAIVDVLTVPCAIEVPALRHRLEVRGMRLSPQ